MTPDHIIELERRGREHREAQASRMMMRERIVELEREVRELRCELEHYKGGARLPFGP